MNYCCIFLGLSILLTCVLIVLYIIKKKKEERRYQQISRGGTLWTRGLAQKYIDQKLNNLK